MICPTCGAYLPDDADFCNVCCHPVVKDTDSISEVQTVEPAVPADESSGPDQTMPLPFSAEEPAPAPVKKRVKLWPAFLTLGIMFLVGLTVFMLLPNSSSGRLSDPAMPWFVPENGTLYFDSEQYYGDPIVKVPASIQGHPVKAIGEQCFAGVQGMIGVEMPDTVQAIGKEAFAGCSDVRGILIPHGVRTIEESAFFGCSALESVCIPNTVEQIGSMAFGGCGKLNHIFYGGTTAQWNELYTQPISPKTFIYATDGSIPHLPMLP